MPYKRQSDAGVSVKADEFQNYHRYAKSKSTASGRIFAKTSGADGLWEIFVKTETIQETKRQEGGSRLNIK